MLSSGGRGGVLAVLWSDTIPERVAKGFGTPVRGGDRMGRTWSCFTRPRGSNEGKKGPRGRANATATPKGHPH